MKWNFKTDNSGFKYKILITENWNLNSELVLKNYKQIGFFMIMLIAYIIIKTPTITEDSSEKEEKSYFTTFPPARMNIETSSQKIMAHQFSELFPIVKHDCFQNVFTSAFMRYSSLSIDRRSTKCKQNCTNTNFATDQWPMTMAILML